MQDDLELMNRLVERKNKLIQYGLQEQPLIIVVGANKIEKSFVHISDIEYEVDSPLKAVDTAFKSFYSLQLQYPKEASHPWMVIQRRIYRIKGETDVTMPCVNSFVLDLLKLKKD